MREYPYDDYGLIINPNTIHLLTSKLCDNQSDKKDTIGYNEELEDKFGLCYVFNFIGDAFPIFDDGTTDWCSSRSESYDDDLICYLPVKKPSKLFGYTYNNVEEILTEFKAVLGEYLPEDYDYRSNLRHFCGTTFG